MWKPYILCNLNHSSVPIFKIALFMYQFMFQMSSHTEIQLPMPFKPDTPTDFSTVVLIQLN